MSEELYRNAVINRNRIIEELQAEVERLKQENTDLKNDKIFAKSNIEALQNENEKLKEIQNELQGLREMYNRAMAFQARIVIENGGLDLEVEKLKEILRKCDPFKLGKCISCRYLYTGINFEANNHKEDCEFIKLTK